MTCVVLAAGASRRLGRPKQFVEIEGETLLQRAARIAAAVAPTIVVTNRECAAHAAALESARTRILINEAPDEGVASSIRAGVAACHGDVLLMTCDQPLITAEHLRALVAAGSLIAATAYSGVLGVPAFFAGAFREELLALRGDRGARGVIEAHGDVAAAVPLEAAGVDVDTDADVQKL